MVPKSQLSPIPGYLGGTGNAARIITNAASHGYRFTSFPKVWW